VLHAIHRPDNKKAIITEIHREIKVGEPFPVDGTFYTVAKVDREGKSPTGMSRVDVHLKLTEVKEDNTKPSKRKKSHRRGDESEA
jgi:hypothetical protein